MKRAVAVLAAVVMVVGATAIRAQIDDDGDAALSGGGGGGGGDDDNVIVCATELEPVCALLYSDNELTIEDPGITAAGLIALDDDAEPDFDVWIVPSPWPTIVDDVRSRAARAAILGTPTDPLASTAVVSVAPTERLVVLDSACAGTVDGACLAEHAGARWADIGGSSAWGQVRPGLDDPSLSTAGLVGLRAVVTSLTGRVDFARNDIETDVVLTALEDLAGIERNTPTGGTPLDLLLVIGPVSYDLALDLEAVARTAVAASANADKFTIADQGVQVDVVAVAPVDRDLDLDLGQLTDALFDAGWDAADVETETARLNPGVYVALQETWEDAR